MTAEEKIVKDWYDSLRDEPTYQWLKRLSNLITTYGLQKQNEVLEWVLSEKGQAVIFEAQTREQRTYTMSELVELYQQTIHS